MDFNRPGARRDLISSIILDLPRDEEEKTRAGSHKVVSKMAARPLRWAGRVASAQPVGVDEMRRDE